MMWRKLYTGIVGDPCLLRLPFWGRWLWVCMICEADDSGRIYADPEWWRNRALIGQKRPSIGHVSGAMATLIEHGLLSFIPDASHIDDSSVPDPDRFRSAFETGSLPKYLRLTNWQKLQARSARPREMRKRERERDEKDAPAPPLRGGDPVALSDVLQAWKARRSCES